MDTVRLAIKAKIFNSGKIRLIKKRTALFPIPKNPNTNILGRGGGKLDVAEVFIDFFDAVFAGRAGYSELDPRNFRLRLRIWDVVVVRNGSLNRHGCATKVHTARQELSIYYTYL